MAPLARLGVLFLCLVTAGGCGADAKVSLDEARKEISAIPNAKTVIDSQKDSAIEGRVESRRASVGFRVTTRNRDQEGFGPHRFASGRSDSGAGCAGAVVYIDRGRGRPQELDLASSIERAVFAGSAPDAYCQG